MHRVTWKCCLRSTEHRSEQAPTAGLSPTRLAPGHICAPCVWHAQTARQIQTRVEASRRRGWGSGVRRALCLRYQVFLALLALGVLGLGARDGHLPWVPSFFEGLLEGVQVFWLRAKHSFRATEDPGHMDWRLRSPPPPPCPNLTLKTTMHSHPEDANPVLFKEHLRSMRHLSLTTCSKPLVQGEILIPAAAQTGGAEKRPGSQTNYSADLAHRVQDPRH